VNNVERRLGKVELSIADYSADEAELIALFGEGEGRVVLEGLKRQGLSVADWMARVAELFTEPDAPSSYDPTWSTKFAGYTTTHVSVEPILPGGDLWRDQERRVEQFRNGAV
jgi:hypothetical protein